MAKSKCGAGQFIIVECRTSKFWSGSCADEPWVSDENDAAKFDGDTAAAIIRMARTVSRDAGSIVMIPVAFHDYLQRWQRVG